MRQICFPGCFGWKADLRFADLTSAAIWSAADLRSAFQDALALRYGWSPLRPPSLCACGTSFSVEHALSCPKGGLPSLRHNEIRDLTATVLTEVCSQVCVEPELQPVQHSDEFPLATSNTQDSARLDVAVNGFWGGRSERCFNFFFLGLDGLPLPTTPSTKKARAGQLKGPDC